MDRVNVFAIHRCINEGYGLIRIFTEKIRISPTKLWRVCILEVSAWYETHVSNNSNLTAARLYMIIDIVGPTCRDAVSDADSR